MIQQIDKVLYITTLFIYQAKSLKTDHYDALNHGLNQVIDHFARNHPYNLTLTKHGYTFLSLSWSPPLNITQFVLHNYQVVYQRNSTPTSNLQIINVPPEKTTYDIKPLKPGTVYRLYVIANYSTGHTPHTHTIIKSTLGYGPDRPCKCHPQFSVSKRCDARTGDCKCKSKGYAPPYCDKCSPHYYLHHGTGLGCQPCGCTNSRATGNCFLKNNSIVMCECHLNYAGRSCTHCKNGFYQDEHNKCIKCECNGNEIHSGAKICNSKGICLACSHNTTGAHCELCSHGYLGDAVNAKNCTFFGYPTMPPDHSAHIATSIFFGATIPSCAIALAAIIAISCWCYKKRRHNNLKFWTVKLGDDQEAVNFSDQMEQPEWSYRSDPLLQPAGQLTDPQPPEPIYKNNRQNLA